MSLDFQKTTKEKLPEQLDAYISPFPRAELYKVTQYLYTFPLWWHFHNDWVCREARRLPQKLRGSASMPGSPFDFRIIFPSSRWTMQDLHPSPIQVFHRIFHCTAFRRTLHSGSSQRVIRSPQKSPQCLRFQSDPTPHFQVALHFQDSAF